MKKIYFDNNATTPIDPAVYEEMLPILKEGYGNPNSIHWAGRAARNKIEEARERVASLINADPSEILFTGGGSESDNNAIKGVWEKLKIKGNHIITTKVEHPAVLDTCKYLKKNGAQITYLSVDKNGNLDLNELKNAITDQTILITIVFANNEVGNIYPIKEITKIAHEKGVLVHTDAVQAVARISVDVADLGVDLLSLSGHKIHAPKGVGALYIKQHTPLEKLIHGGHQEKGRRAGTENTVGIIGLGKACEIAQKELAGNMEKISKLRDRLEARIIKEIPHTKLNGDKESRVPNTSNISFLYVEGEAILLNLDLYGIAASSGSACTSGSLDPSHVLLAIGLSHEVAHGSIRFSLSKFNTEKEVDYVLKVLPETIERLRKISPLYK